MGKEMGIDLFKLGGKKDPLTLDELNKFIKLDVVLGNPDGVIGYFEVRKF